MILAARPRSLTRHSTGSIWLNVANRRFQRTWLKSHRLAGAGVTERTVKTDLPRQTTQICASRAGKINVSKHVHSGIGAASRNNRDIKSLSRNKLIADLSPKASEMPLPREALVRQVCILGHAAGTAITHYCGSDLSRNPTRARPERPRGRMRRPSRLPLSPA
jgi:hypothetical protein